MIYKIPTISRQHFYILGMALFLGFLVVLQSRSYEDVNDYLIRDIESNIFREIGILKASNEDLKKEIEGLDSAMEQLSDQNLALSAIEDEIEKYTKLSGRKSIFGSGVAITIDSQISSPWIIDLINELFNSGAEAVSVNSIRMTNQSVGFDTLPQGQILINGSILSPPYIFGAIGQSSNLKAILEAPGGLLTRMQAAIPTATFSIETKEVIQMD